MKLCMASCEELKVNKLESSRISLSFSDDGIAIHWIFFSVKSRKSIKSRLYVYVYLNPLTYEMKK